MGKREIFNQPMVNPLEDALRLEAQKNMQTAQIMAEVRATASTLFAASIAPYLQALVMESAMASQGGRPDPAILRSFAVLSAKAAPYLAEAQGRINIDESKHWADLQPIPEAPQLAEAG